MTFLNKIPGSILIFLGALCLSFGGIIVKSFEGATEWQILFWRQFFFSITVVIYLIFAYTVDVDKLKKSKHKNKDKKNKIIQTEVSESEIGFIDSLMGKK